MKPSLLIPVLLFILSPLTGQRTVDNTGWKSTGFYAEALGGTVCHRASTSSKSGMAQIVFTEL